MSGVTDINTRPVSTTVGATHDTGFPEPFSERANTTLAHPEGAARPSEELDMSLIEEGKKKRMSRLLPGKKWKNSQEMERDMYSGLEAKDADEVDANNYPDADARQPGKVKKVLHKLSCGVV